MKEALRLVAFGAETYWVWPSAKPKPVDASIHAVKTTQSAVKQYSEAELAALLEKSLGPQLTPAQRTEAMSKLLSFTSVFQPPTKEPPPRPQCDIRLELKPDSVPKQCPPFSLTEEEQAWLGTFLDDFHCVVG